MQSSIFRCVRKVELYNHAVSKGFFLTIFFNFSMTCRRLLILQKRAKQLMRHRKAIFFENLGRFRFKSSPNVWHESCRSYKFRSSTKTYLFNTLKLDINQIKFRIRNTGLFSSTRKKTFSSYHHLIVDK